MIFNNFQLVRGKYSIIIGQNQALEAYFEHFQ